MAVKVLQDYSQFYKGTEALKSYGNGEGKKDTLVKYEFNTTDERGNKIMDKMSKEETLRTMKEISAQYGDNVLVEFSGDGLAALVEAKKGNLDEIMKPDAEKQARMEESIVHLENTHRIFIPNVQTNEQLYHSLEGADENTIKAANGIIKNYLLPGDAAGMTEEERKDRIAFGLETAKYLAENYLGETQAKEFFSAMETIAKYGMNGTVSKDGKVTYHIEKGPIIGSSEDYTDILKKKAPDLYKEINELNQKMMNRKDGETFYKQFLELYKKAETVVGANREEVQKEYAEWQEEVDKTKVPDTFKNVKYTDMQAFFNSLRNQSSLSGKWMENNINRFMGWL